MNVLSGIKTKSGYSPKSTSVVERTIIPLTH